MTKEERAKLIEHLLAGVEDDCESKGKQLHPFIISVRAQFDQRGDLSDKQIAAVQKFYDRIDS